MGGRSIWEVAVAAIILVITLLCSNSCWASGLIRKPNNATAAAYGEVAVEFMVGSVEMVWFLNFKGVKTHTDKTNNPNVKSCNNGAGNPMGVCGGNSRNKKHCNAYAGAAKCSWFLYFNIFCRTKQTKLGCITLCTKSVGWTKKIWHIR